MKIPLHFSPDTWGHVPEAEQNELVADFSAQMGLGIDRKLGWATELAQVSARLASGRPSPSDLPLFWIRLHGMLAEMAPTPWAPYPPENEIQRRLVALDAETRKRYDAIRAAVTDDEIIYVDYRRTLEAHCYANSYFLRSKGKGEAVRLIRSRFVTALDRECPLTEIRDAIGRVGAAGDPVRVAEVLAAKLAAPLASYAEWVNTPFDVFGDGGMPSVE